MDILNNIFKWILENSISTSIFILLIILFRKFFKDKIKPNFIYLLWIIVIIKLIVPINIPWNYSFYNLMPDSYIEYSNTSPTIYDNNINTNIPTNTVQNTKNIINNIEGGIDNEMVVNNDNPKLNNSSNLFVSIWILGIISISIIFLISHIKFKLSQKNNQIISDLNILKLFNDLKSKLNIKRNIKLHTGNTFNTTFISGILNPKIFIPSYYLDNLDIEKLEYILIHELSHYKRKDILVNYLQIIIQIFYWFNPIIYIAMKYIRDDRELACDDYVMEFIEEDNSIDYGMTIIEMARITVKNNNRNYLVSFSNKEPLIKRRIKMVDRFRKINTKAKIAIFILIVIIAGIFLTNYNNDIFSGEKVYYDINNMQFEGLYEAMDYIDFDFKIPSYLEKNYEIQEVSKINDIFFINYSRRDPDSDYINLRFYFSKNNLIDFFNHKLESPNYKLTNRKINNIDFSIIKATSNYTDINVNTYLWKDNDIYYGIEGGVKVNLDKDNSLSTGAMRFYEFIEDLIEYDYFKVEELKDIIQITTFTNEDLINITKSMKDIDKIRLKPFYSDRMHENMRIMNSDDLYFIEEKLGYKLLFPNRLNDDYKIQDNQIYGLRKDDFEEDISFYALYANRNKNYESQIQLIQNNSEHDNEFFEENILNLEKININNIDVYYNDENELSIPGVNIISYTWRIKDSRIYTVIFISHDRGKNDLDPIGIITPLIKQSKKIK